MFLGVRKDFCFGMETYAPLVALVPRTPARITKQPVGSRFPTPSGAVSTGGNIVFVPSALELYIYGRIFDPVMEFILPGRCWLYEFYESPPISNQPVGYRPGGPQFSSPVCWRCTCKDGFMVQGWDLILPGWRWLHEPQVGVSASCVAVSTRGATVFVPGLIALYMYEMGLGVHTVRGGVDAGGPPFSSPVCWSCRYTQGL